MEQSKADRTVEFTSFLKGGKDLDINQAVTNDVETFARAMVECLDSKYHRNNLAKSLLGLINGPNLAFRNVSWAMIQNTRIPLSHLLEIVPAIKKNGKHNSRRIRFALTVRIANSSKFDIVRAYFMGPSKFRDLWVGRGGMYLPRDKCDDRPINNENYKFAYQLSQKSIPGALTFLGIKYPELVSKYKMPLEKVMGMVDDVEDALELARMIQADNFMHHARWFRNILGDDEYSNLMIGKIEKIKDPIKFLAKKKHLEDTGAILPKFVKQLDVRANTVVSEMVADFDLERFALLVDISGSMQDAVTITAKLNDVFSRMENKTVTDVIAFGDAKVFNVPVSRDIRHLICDGVTPIGGAIVKLSKNIGDRNHTNIPQAIILISDMCENRTPYLNNALPLLLDDDKVDNPPLIILHCGSYRQKLVINEYPHSYITVDEFHDGLLMDMMKNIMMLTTKVAVVEKHITKVVKERHIQQEVLGDVELPVRDPATLLTSYLPRLLCGPCKRQG